MEGYAGMPFSVDVKAALVARPRAHSRRRETGWRILECAGSMTIVPAGSHISSDRVGGLPLCRGLGFRCGAS
jgi:hypothetical protein